MGEIADMMIDAYMFGGARDDEEAMEIGLGLRRPRWGDYDRTHINWREAHGGDAAERQKDVAAYQWRNGRGKVRAMHAMRPDELEKIAQAAGRCKLTGKLAEIREVLRQKKAARCAATGGEQP